MQQLTTFEVHTHGQELKLMMSEMPFGDPFSGTPYGQYNKSKALGMVIGIVSSVVTMGAALPMLASTVLATQIAGGVMMAGGVLTGVGAVTGNKKLAMIGGILSLAGAAGGAISGMMGGEGATGMFAEGSGSTSVQNFAGKMMGSINDMGINVFNPDLVSGAKAAGEAGVGNVGDALEGGSMGEVVDAGLQAPDSGTNLNVQPDVAPGATPKLQLQTDGILEPDAVGGELKLDKPEFYADRGDTGILNKGVADGPASSSVANPVPDQTISPDRLEAMRTGGTAPPPEKGGLGSWLEKNKDYVKIGGEFLSKFADGANAPDQQSYIDALAAKYSAEVDVLKNQSELQKYQLANMGKQVAMISADDTPENIQAQVNAAKAAGHAVAFIPKIGTGGVQRNPNSPTMYGTAARTAAQTPIRQATNTGVA